MADPTYRERQLMVYLPSREVLDRWKALAAPASLSRWVYLQVEKSIEPTLPAPTTDPDDINTLIKENTLLRTELALLEQQLSKYAQAELDRANQEPDIPVNLNVVSLLRSGGKWSAPNLAKELKIKNRQEAESIVTTLEQLEKMEIVKKDHGGWKWTA